MSARWMRLAAAVPCLALLAGCGNRDEQELRHWMKAMDSQARIKVSPLAAPKNFIPYAYQPLDAIDPFNPNKLLAELAKTADRGGSLAPDTTRRKEALESFALETLRMVGTMEKGGVMAALLQSDRSVYLVQAGQHVGQNFGLITRVSDNAVTIKEIVQDATGDWVERISKLELQDSKENGK